MAKMDKYFSDISSIILKFTNCYHKNVLNEIVESDEYISEPKRFFYVVMRKTKDVLESSNVFIRNFNSHYQYKVSIYILLRSILADIIVAEYVIISTKNDIERQKKIKSIYADHIKKTYQAIDGIYAKIKGWNSAKIEKIKKDFIKTKSEYFNENEKIIPKPTKTSPERLIRILFSQKPKNKDYKLLEYAFHYYDIFSKYEHLGDLSFFLVHRVYDSNKWKDGFFEIFECLNIIFSALINYCDCWENRFLSVKKELIIIQKEFYNMNLE